MSGEEVNRILIFSDVFQIDFVFQNLALSASSQADLASRDQKAEDLKVRFCSKLLDLSKILPSKLKNLAVFCL